MESAQALLAAQAADAIVGFLHRVHRQERGPLPNARLEYDRNEAFNTYVDEGNEEVRVFDLTYRPSEVLFAVDHEAYCDLLAGYKPGDDEPADDAAPETPGSAP